MSNSAMNWAMSQTGISQTQKWVLVCLSYYAGRDHVSYPPMGKILETCLISRSTAESCLKALQCVGLIDRVTRGKKGGGRAPGAYKLNIESPGQLNGANVQNLGISNVQNLGISNVQDLRIPKGAYVQDLRIVCPRFTHFKDATPYICLKESLKHSISPPKKNGRRAPVKNSDLATQKKSAPERAPTADTWDKYSAAYRQRYGIDPVRNALVNSCIAAFVKRIGAEESPFVAEYYVYSNNAYYVRTGHSVKSLLADAESLRTQWATGKQITQRQARQADDTQSNLNAVHEAKRLAARRHKGA